jgi:hypothetical protein
MFDLIVKEPFGMYQKGTRITNQEIVQQIEGGANAHHCIRVAAIPQTTAAQGEPAKPRVDNAEVEADIAKLQADMAAENAGK